jgi:hypothetical protein
MTNKTQIHHDLKGKKASLQHCIKAIASFVVNQSSVHLINFGSGGKTIALKSATALILNRYLQAEKKPPHSQAHLVFANAKCQR